MTKTIKTPILNSDGTSARLGREWWLCVGGLSYATGFMKIPRRFRIVITEDKPPRRKSAQIFLDRYAGIRGKMMYGMVANHDGSAYRSLGDEVSRWISKNVMKGRRKEIRVWICIERA